MTYVAFSNIVWVLVDISCQAEVANLHHVLLGQQNIPGSQVPVDALEEGGVAWR